MPDSVKIQAGTPLLTYVEQWLAHCRRHTVNTQEVYFRVINDFIKSLPADVGQLNPVDINIYINHLLPMMKNSAVNTYLTVLKSFFKWLNENYSLPNITEKVKYLKTEPPDVRVVDHAEYLKIIESNKDNPDLPVIKFLSNTGLRASELCGIKPSDINGKWLKVRYGKGRKSRMIPLNKVAQESLKNMQLPKSRDQLYYRCRKAAKTANVPSFGPHSLRHYFATELLRRGVPIMSVSKLLGHSSVTITEKIYYHFSYHHIENVTDVLEQ